MAEQLKLMYNEAFISRLANRLSEVDSSIDPKAFSKAVMDQEWENLELKARTIHIAETFQKFLPYSYPEQIKLLMQVAPDFTGYAGTIFPTFVELYGLEDSATSMAALENFTQYSTGEFAIRPFLNRSPDLIEQLYEWSKSDNFHVRRLASEGCRPLLPWGMKLQQYVKDPSPILPILKTLRNDSEDYVYRSVANNLNDISKNQPEVVLDLCETWINESKTTKWVCKHALRTLLKKGNQRAMQLFGFGSIEELSIIHFELANEKIKIGAQSLLNIMVKNNGASAKFRLEYAIGYLKKNGSHSEKVFQLRETELGENGQLEFDKKLDFKDLSTRKHYSGKHYICLKVNGIEVERLAFELVE